MRDTLQALGETARARADSVRDAAHHGWQAVLGRIFQLDLVVERAIKVAFIIVVALITYRVVKLITHRIVTRDIAEDDPLVKRQRKQRIETIAGLMNNVAATVIFTLATLTALNYVGVPIASLLASVGVAGLAISFGAQSLVKDIITGAFILGEGQYGIGDVVKLGDISGAVERVTLRTTTLRDVYGTVHTIPNGQIAQVSNLTKSWSRAVVDVSVAYKEDVDRVITLLRDVGMQLAADDEWGQLLLGDPEVPGVENLADSGVLMRIMVKTLPLKQWDVARELRRRIKLRFEREQIVIPVPTITFFWGDGQLPPALEAPGVLAVGPGQPDAGR